MTIGENIKRIRLQRGLTQDELGYLIGVPDSMIRKYELGILNPKQKRLAEIAYALGVNIEALTNSDFDNIRAMHRLFQLFRQYSGDFINNSGICLQFDKLDLQPWYERWQKYEAEKASAALEPNEEKRKEMVEDAEDKFIWWMIFYPHETNDQDLMEGKNNEQEDASN